MEEYFIPMVMKGSTCTFTMRCPMNEEFQQCLQIILSNRDHWDPSDKICHIALTEEERGYSVGRAPTPSRNICFFRLTSNSLLPLVMETQYDVNIHDFG